jgi:hypothetical protein
VFHVIGEVVHGAGKAAAPLEISSEGQLRHTGEDTTAPLMLPAHQRSVAEFIRVVVRLVSEHAQRRVENVRSAGGELP